MDAVEAVNPNGSLFLICQQLVFVLIVVIFVFVRDLLRDSIGMVCLIIEDEDVFLSANVAPQRLFGVKPYRFPRTEPTLQIPF